MTVAYIVLTIVAAFSAFTSGMAAGVQIAGIYGAKFTYGPLLGPSWTCCLLGGNAVKVRR